MPLLNILLVVNSHCLICKDRKASYGDGNLDLVACHAVVLGKFNAVYMV